jgi:hypothetical protein
MEGSAQIEIGAKTGQPAARADCLPRYERLCRFLRSSRLPTLLGILAVIVLFSLDVWAPRGMTLAIGYAIVPVVAGGTRDRRTVVVLAAVCTLLAWIAFFAEPPGAAWWMSAGDRLMVSAVVWARRLWCCAASP